MNSTQLITSFIKDNSPFVFTKYGDGEYNTCIYTSGFNVEHVPYTKELGDALIESIRYFSKVNNAYIGKWHTENVSVFFQSQTDSKINWVNYHTIILDKDSIHKPDILEFFKSIKYSKREKILVSNNLLEKATILLDIPNFYVIPNHGWEEKRNEIKNDVIKIVKSDDPLICIAGGMSSKPLLQSLHQQFPKAILIDIGCCLDWICTKRDSRGFSTVFSYEQLYNYFSPLLPSNWNDPKYEIIYKLAPYHMGMHLKI